MRWRDLGRRSGHRRRGDAQLALYAVPPLCPFTYGGGCHDGPKRNADPFGGTGLLLGQSLRPAILRGANLGSGSDGTAGPQRDLRREPLHPGAASVLPLPDRSRHLYAPLRAVSGYTAP